MSHNTPMFPCAGRGPELDNAASSRPSALPSQGNKDVVCADPASDMSAVSANPSRGEAFAAAANPSRGEAFDAANPSRGEAVLVIAGEPWKLRPSFTALVAAEEELGSLFALVERAASGGLKLTEMVALFWHCCEARQGHRPTRDQIGDTICAHGLASVTPQLRLLLEAVLKGGG